MERAGGRNSRIVAKSGFCDHFDSVPVGYFRAQSGTTRFAGFARTRFVAKFKRSVAERKGPRCELETVKSGEGSDGDVRPGRNSRVFSN